MDPIPVQVQCYSGHQPSPMGYGLAGKADERPLRFVCEGGEIEVVEVLDQWLAASREAGQLVLVPYPQGTTTKNKMFVRQFPSFVAAEAVKSHQKGRGSRAKRPCHREAIAHKAAGAS